MLSTKTIVLAMLMASHSVCASAVVPQAYVNVARSVGVPAELLYAIALQESRLSLSDTGVLPWPWTLNVRGKAMRFQNHKETVQAIEHIQSQGTKSIDVGLMQVNLFYHGQRFTSIGEAVHPYHNIRVGAMILKEEYERCESDWWCATGRYHSYRKKRAHYYTAGVRTLWQSLKRID